jgi:hypothetical protein
MPAWLGQRASWDTESGSDAAGNFFNGERQELAVKQAHLNLASGLLGLQQQHQTIDMNAIKIADQAKGMQEFPAWLKSTGGDWKKVLDTPFTGTSQYGSEMAEKVQQAAWQKGVQQQAVDLKQQQVDNQLAEAQQKADLESQRIDVQKQKNDIWANIEDRLATVQEQKAAAAKAGKTSEFEAIQTDWQSTMTAINAEDDPAKLKLLLARQKQDEDRMKKLSTFASEIPTKKTTVEATDAKTGVKTTESITEPVNPPNVPQNAPRGAKNVSQPTRTDVSYLASHPELKSQFEARFGAGSADQYLP